MTTNGYSFLFGVIENFQKTDYYNGYTPKISEKSLVVLNFKLNLIVRKLEKAMATHSSTLAWKIPWTEGPGGLQSMGSLGIGHD